MAHSETERNFGADISLELYNRLEANISAMRNPKKKQLVTAMAELWLSLPDALQATLLSASPESTSFLEVVQAIVDDRIAKGYADGRKFVAKRRKSKRSRKG